MLRYGARRQIPMHIRPIMRVRNRIVVKVENAEYLILAHALGVFVRNDPLVTAYRIRQHHLAERGRQLSLEGKLFALGHLRANQTI